MRRLTVVLLSLCSLLLLLFLVTPFALQAAGDFLRVQDKLAKADAIIVLAGDDNGERVNQGVKLFKAGYADKILMSGGPLAWRLTAAEWMKKQAVAEGIPPPAIIVQDRSRSTIDDARFSLPLAAAQGWRSVILVTSPYHTRRAGNVFRKVFGDQHIKVIVQPAEPSAFSFDRWWTRYEDRGAVVWEYVSFVLYFFKGY